MQKTLSFMAVSLALGWGSAFAQEREWVLDAAESDVFLVFGVPGSNDVGVSFWCKVGGKKVNLFSPLQASQKLKQAKLVIELAVGDAKYPLQARRVASEVASSIEAGLKPQAEILEKLEAAESFSVTVARHKVNYPLEGADFNGLVKLCGLKTG